MKITIQTKTTELVISKAGTAPSAIKAVLEDPDNVLFIESPPGTLLLVPARHVQWVKIEPEDT